MERERYNSLFRSIPFNLVFAKARRLWSRTADRFLPPNGEPHAFDDPDHELTANAPVESRSPCGDVYRPSSQGAAIALYDRLDGPRLGVLPRARGFVTGQQYRKT